MILAGARVAAAPAAGAAVSAPRSDRAAASAALSDAAGPLAPAPADTGATQDTEGQAPLLVPGRPAPGDTSAAARRAQALEKYRLGLTFERQGIYAPAIAAYQMTLHYDPTFPDANYRMGRLYLTKDQVREAARCFAGEVRHHPENLDADRELGLALARMGDTTRAIPRLERLTRLRPDTDENWRALGFAYSTAGRPVQAEAALRRAIQLQPRRAVEHRDLGVVLASLGREDEARAQYRQALAIDRTDASVWLNLGNLERRTGHLEAALDAYRTAERHDSTFATAIQGEIGVLVQLKRDAEAGATYRRWLKLKPDDHNARLEAVRHFHAAGRADIALEVARDGVRRFPSSADAHMILGIAHQFRGESRAALAELRQAESLFKEPAGKKGADELVAMMRAAAPDSLRRLFSADSVAHAAAAAQDSVKRTARAGKGGGKP